MPERGDVVIVTPPGRNTDYIKRLIGLPGDRLQVRGGVLYINGEAVRRGPIHDRIRLALGAQVGEEAPADQQRGSEREQRGPSHGGGV